MFKPAQNSSRGFTLIELLIVIAVIGILAIAVLSAINPVEQIKKGNDTAQRSDAAEFLAAVERYNVTFRCYPWAYTSSGCTGTVKPDKAAVDPTLRGGTAGSGLLNATIIELDTSSAELKPEFKGRSSLKKLYVTQGTTGADMDLVHVCFNPESKSMRALAKLQRNGTTDCTAGTFDGTATSCHICVPE